MCHPINHYCKGRTKLPPNRIQLRPDIDYYAKIIVSDHIKTSSFLIIHQWLLPKNSNNSTVFKFKT